MGEVVSFRLRDLLPHVAQALSPPGDGAFEALGIEPGGLAEFGLGALQRRLRLIGVAL